MASVNRVYAARLAGMVVLGPDGESFGRVRDVVASISIVRPGLQTPEYMTPPSAYR